MFPSSDEEIHEQRPKPEKKKRKQSPVKSSYVRSRNNEERHQQVPEKKSRKSPSRGPSRTKERSRSLSLDERDHNQPNHQRPIETNKNKSLPILISPQASPPATRSTSPEDERSNRQVRGKTPANKQSAVSSTSRAHHASTSNQKKKPFFKPIPSKKSTARDLFGSESENEDSPALPGKKSSPIVSYMSRRLSNGHSRQVYDNKPGTHFIDLRIYRCDEIERVQPINRWRQAIICVKNRTDDNTEAWQHMANFIIATRKEYRNCPVTFFSNYH